MDRSVGVEAVSNGQECSSWDCVKWTGVLELRLCLKDHNRLTNFHVVLAAWWKRGPATCTTKRDGLPWSQEQTALQTPLSPDRVLLSREGQITQEKEREAAYVYNPPLGGKWLWVCGYESLFCVHLGLCGFGCVAMTILCACGSVWVWVCGYDYFVGLCGFGCVAECLSVYACGSVWVWACGCVIVCMQNCVGLGVWLCHCVHAELCGFGCVAVSLCACRTVWVWVCGYDYFVGLCGFGCVAECLSVYACGSVWVWACGCVIVCMQNCVGLGVWLCHCVHAELCGFGCVAVSGYFMCTWVCVGLGVWLWLFCVHVGLCGFGCVAMSVLVCMHVDLCGFGHVAMSLCACRTGWVWACGYECLFWVHMGLCGFGCVALTILYAHGFGYVAMTILCVPGSVWV